MCIYFFLDTNLLRGDSKKFPLVDFKLQGVYPKIVSTMKKNDEDFKILIPNLIISELKKQYTEAYSEYCKNCILNLEYLNSGLKEKIVIKDITQSLIKEEDYRKFIKEKQKEYCKSRSYIDELKDCHLDQSEFEKLIKMAINGELPFFKGQSNKKKFSDAGFKDTIIAQVLKKFIINKFNDEDYLVIASKDKEMHEYFFQKYSGYNNIYVTNEDDGIKLLEKSFEKFKIDFNIRKLQTLKSDSYFLENLYSELNLIDDFELEDFKNEVEVNNIEILAKKELNDDEDDIYYFSLEINLIKYKIYVDVESSEITGVISETI